jgi:hypothetical protein
MRKPTFQSACLRPLLAAPLLVLALAACASLGGSRSLEDQIREFIYANQPSTGQQFVSWADTALAGYSSQQVFTALHNEGEFQARSGHPNAVSVLSFAARAWAEQKHLQYAPDRWLAMQDEAKKNLRSDPGQLQLWPPENK